MIEACSTTTLKGYQIYFHPDKGVRGVDFMNWYKHFPTHSLILTSSMLLKGLISIIKAEKFVMQALMGVFAEKDKKH